VSVFSQNSATWKVASGVLAVTSTVLSALTRQVRSGEIAQLHALATRSWVELIQKIEVALHEPDIENLWDKVRELRTEASAILQSQPEPSLMVVSYFNKRFQSVPFALHPELAAIAKARAAESLVMYPGVRRSPRVQSTITPLPAPSASRYAGLGLSLGGRLGLVDPEETLIENPVAREPSNGSMTSVAR
jgi:hypothetical protein